MKKLSGQQISPFVQCGQTVPTAEIQIIKAAKNKCKSTLLNCLNTIAVFDRQTAMHAYSICREDNMYAENGGLPDEPNSISSWSVVTHCEAIVMKLTLAYNQASKLNGTKQLKINMHT